jgi:hypothetical protein
MNPTKKNPPGKKIMMLISFYGSLAGLPWSKCWNGMRESTRRKTTLSGMTREQVMALRQCGLLKFFKIQGMRAQLRLLEYLVHMWDVNEQAFHVGAHTLTIDIEDIYFLTGLSHHGSRVTLTGSRGGGEPMNHYISEHCVVTHPNHSTG